MSDTQIVAIVDDDEGVRTALTSLIRSLGYEVRSYASATAFLDDRDMPDPDCMISDIQMPQMTGDELQAALIDAGRRFPIIFMTAFPTRATRERVMRSGACAFLDKPADGAVIAHHLAAALGGAAHGPHTLV